MSPVHQNASALHHPPVSSRPTTLNPGPRDPRPLQPPQAKELERRLHRQVLQTIRETFGRD